MFRIHKKNSGFSDRNSFIDDFDRMRPEFFAKTFRNEEEAQEHIDRNYWKWGGFQSDFEITN